jgi:ABC-2 type transport system permease protein
MSGLRVDLLQLIRTPFDMVGMLVWPLVFASIAYLLLGHASGERPLFTASLGAAVMIMWGWVILGAGFALDTQREQGTLELVVGAPTPLVVLISPVMISRAVFGIYGLLLTLVWGRLLFGIPLLIDDWAAFLAAAVGCILAIGTLGLWVDLAVLDPAGMVAAPLLAARSYLGIPCVARGCFWSGAVAGHCHVLRSQPRLQLGRDSVPSSLRIFGA